MTVLERKAIAIRRILDANDQDFERLEQFLNSIESEEYPCRYTVEEVRNSARRASEDYRGGKKNFMSQEELIARYKGI